MGSLLWLKFTNHARNTKMILGLTGNMVQSSFTLTPKRYFLLITQILVSFPTILEGENDGCGARSKAWNDVFWKLTIALMIFRFTEAN
nr:hypothetical protein [Tanacetum cinerariifolium]